MFSPPAIERMTVPTVQRERSFIFIKSTASKQKKTREAFRRFQFFARDVIYTFRANATMSVFVCPSVFDGSALAHYS